jgi:hypothetical protein
MKARHCVEKVIILLIYVTIVQMAGALDNFKKTGINAALAPFLHASKILLPASLQISLSSTI